MMERKNINRGYKQLNVWKDAIELYVMTIKLMVKFPYEMKKVVSNFIDASQSISRNIAEGYARKSINEYLNFLNIALGSSAEFHSCLVSFNSANQITKEDFEKLDIIHFKVENELINLIKSIQLKREEGGWNDSFIK